MLLLNRTSKPVLLELVQHNSKPYFDTVNLRYAVLRKPLGLIFSLNQLEHESSSFHVACYFDNVLAGCLVLQPDGDTLRMRQVAVTPKYRACGLGRAMVEFAEQFARNEGYSKICLHARSTCVGFYLALGYRVEGAPFEERSRIHLNMFKNIAQPERQAS